MTPRQVKDLAIEAVNKQDPVLALEVCSVIVKDDLYINVPKPHTGGEGKYTVARWGDRPCKCGCGEIISPGTYIWWEPNWGAYFADHH